MLWVTCVKTPSLFHDAGFMKTIFHKLVSIISKINGSFLCKYACDAFIMSVEENKTLKIDATEKLHKAHHTPREAVQQLLK